MQYGKQPNVLFLKALVKKANVNIDRCEQLERLNFHIAPREELVSLVKDLLAINKDLTKVLGDLAEFIS
jgi:hypothetical protein